MISSKYVQSAVHNVQDYLAALPGDQKLPKKAYGPFTGGYNPELDESPELDSIIANFYKSHIVILRWCVYLGRIDIITEVSMLSTYLCLPCEGHLEAVFHVFASLGLHHNARVVFDPTYPSIYMGTFIKTDWKSMYGDVKEIIPSGADLCIQWVHRSKAVVTVPPILKYALSRISLEELKEYIDDAAIGNYALAYCSLCE
jgi:hypothetical protein